MAYGLLDDINYDSGGLLGETRNPYNAYAYAPDESSGAFGANPTGRAPGFMDRLGNALTNPLVTFGLGLASGRTPQEGFAGALGAIQMQQKLAQANLTGDIKEYQYARSQGFQGTFADWQKQQANLRGQWGLNPQWYQYKDADGNIKWGIAQLGNQGGVNSLQAPNGGAWAPPNTQIQLPDRVIMTPRNQAPGYGAAPNALQAPTTSATDDMGRPVVPEGPSQTGTGTSYSKDYIRPQEEKGIGDANAKEYGAIQKDAFNAVSRKNTFSRMSQLNDEAYSGAGAPGIQYAHSLLSSFGVAPGSVPAGEELTALSNRLVLDATGGSLGNQISNADRDFIAATNPNLANTKEGRARMIEIGTKLEDRKIEVAKLAREYRGKKGNMNGFNEYLAQWSEEHPLFQKKSDNGSGDYSEGTIIRNPKTGERRVRRNGEWVPLQ